MSLQLTITVTDEVTELDGVQCRVWDGVTPKGSPCKVFVHRVAMHNLHDGSELDAALREFAPPAFHYRTAAEVLLADDAAIQREILGTQVMLLRRVVELAATSSTFDAIDLVCSYFEEAGVDDPALQGFIDDWRNALKQQTSEDAETADQERRSS